MESLLRVKCVWFSFLFMKCVDDLALNRGFPTSMVYLYNDSQDIPFWSEILEMVPSN